MTSKDSATGPKNHLWSLLFFILVICLFSMSCSLVSTRPVQEMSQTSAAIRAAKEVQADVLAPELFRQASEYFFKAKREYKFKNFRFASVYAKKARRFAEEAEFEALRNGGNRTNDQIPDPMSNNVVVSRETAKALSKPPEPSPSPGSEAPLEEPKPTGTPADVYEQRKAAEDEAARKADSPLNAPSPAPTQIVVPLSPSSSGTFTPPSAPPGTPSTPPSNGGGPYGR